MKTKRKKKENKLSHAKPFLLKETLRKYLGTSLISSVNSSAHQEFFIRTNFLHSTSH